MSVSIDEGIERAEARAASLREVKKRFPEATLRDGRWTTNRSGRDANALHFENGFFHPVVDVGGVYVFASMREMSPEVLLVRLERDHPDFYKALVAVVAGREP